MSAFLTFRSLLEPGLRFADHNFPVLDIPDPRRTPVRTPADVDVVIAETVERALASGPTALMLSGGIDSILVASHLPPGTPAYTFRISGGADESAAAAAVASRFGLDHRVIDITWHDYLAAAPALFARKGAPFHSIEAQIFRAGVEARRAGIENLLFGENADIAFGGFDGLLGQDWQFDDFVDRYTHVDPTHALVDGRRITWPFERFRRGEGIDVHAFLNEFFYREANGSYQNSCSAAGVAYMSPFRGLALADGLDLARVRGGEPKYLLRELFRQRLDGFDVPAKRPMPRGVGYWLRDWAGPRRAEFRPGAADGATGDQRWLMFICEVFLDWLDGADVADSAAATLQATEPGGGRP